MLPGPAQTGGGSTAGTPGDGEPGVGAAGDRRFSVVDMAALGGVLGALLLLALLALLILVHKHYGQQLKCCSGKAVVRPWGAGGRTREGDRQVRWTGGQRRGRGGSRGAEGWGIVHTMRRRPKEAKRKG